MFKNLHAMAFAAKASAPTTMTLKGFAYQVLDPVAFHTDDAVDDYRIFTEHRGPVWYCLIILNIILAVIKYYLYLWFSTSSPVLFPVDLWIICSYSGLQPPCKGAHGTPYKTFLG